MTDPSIFDKLRCELDSEFINRGEEIDAIIHALTSRAHMVMLGVPGTAKSALLRRATARISGATMFRTIMMKDADSSALFGSMSIAGLKQDRRVRIDGPWVQRVHVAFLDEVFKANASSLNAILTAMNEREFEENGVPQPIPLVSMFGASNEMPEPDAGLGALWDRWHYRMVVQPLTEASDLKALAKMRWTPEKELQPVLALDDLVAAQQAAAATPVSDDAVDALVQIIVDLRRQHGIEVTNRKFQEALKFAATAAWLDGAAQAEVGHIGFTRHMFWDHTDQIGDVEKLVLSIADPNIADALDIRDEVTGLGEQLAEALRLDADDLGRSASAAEIMGKLKRAAIRLHEIEQSASGRSARVLADVADRVDAANNEIMVEIHGLTPGAVPGLVEQARAGTLTVPGRH